VSEENVELVRRAAELFVNEGLEASLVYSAEDIVAYPFPEWIGRSEYRGHDGMRSLLAEWTDNFDDLSFEFGQFFDSGDWVVATFRMSGRIKGSGAPLSQLLAAASGRFRDGKVGETHYFLTVEQAFAFAGLEEPVRRTGS
jgi:ketosteroid isomerase-like protein